MCDIILKIKSFKEFFMDLIKFIEPTKLDNIDDNQRHGDGEFVTKDLVFLRSMLDVKEMLEEERIIYPTDYAIMNGAMMSSGRCGKEKRKSCWTWLRSAYSTHYVEEFGIDGYLYSKVFLALLVECVQLCILILHLLSPHVVRRKIF